MTGGSRCTGSPDDAGGTDGALRVRQLCLDHAGDLITSAEKVLSNNEFPHIAYHLAIIALEEIGKAGMIASRAVAGSTFDSAWIDKALDDHIRKLQWAVWTPSLSAGRIDPKDFEDARCFAQDTHARRLNGLYVKPSEDASTVTPPSDAVNTELAVSLISLARARLETETSTKMPALSVPNDNLRWFLDTVSNEEGKKRIFSKSFIDKYEKLEGNTRAWVAWARAEFEKIAAEERQHLQKELERLPAAPQASRPKWIIKIRLYTSSHSIRPKILNYWNGLMNWAKLSPVANKNSKELMLVLKLDNSVTVKNLYEIGLSLSKLCIAALNIGSLGFFWHDLSRQTSRYYEDIKDVEAPNMKLDIAKGSGLSDEWEQTALSEEDLRRAIRCIVVFGRMADEEAAPIFRPYLYGLVLLSKSDVHLSCEKEARDVFIESLRKATEHFGDWDGCNETLVPSLHRTFGTIVPEPDHRNLLFEILSSPRETEEPPLAQAVSAKRLTDLYLVMIADRQWSKLQQRGQVSPP